MDKGFWKAVGSLIGAVLIFGIAYAIVANISSINAFLIAFTQDLIQAVISLLVIVALIVGIGVLIKKSRE